VLATGGCAQHRIATSFAELAPRVKTGQMYVTTLSGDVHKGTLEAMSAGTARVNISGATMQISERETAQIAVPEPALAGSRIWRGGWRHTGRTCTTPVMVNRATGAST
jgi:hypothetical protein